MNYKKSSKKSNIPVSPARDKFNTILLILMFGSIITLVVLSFLAAVMSSYGRFQEGMSGLLIGTFLTRIAYCLCMLSIPVILYKKVVKNKILRGGFNICGATYCIFYILQSCFRFMVFRQDIVLKIICWKKLSKRLRLHIFRIQKSFLI